MAPLTNADILLRAGGAEFARSGRLVRRQGLWLPGGDGDSYTFSRADGTTPLAHTENRRGGLSLVAQNGVRVDYQAGAALFMEKASYNTLLRSEALDNAAWTKSGATVTANAVASPRGDVTADKLVENGANSDHYVDQAVAGIDTGLPVSISIFAKAAQRTKLLFVLCDTAAEVNAVQVTADLAAGTIGAVTLVGAATGGKAWIEALAGGWYRVSVAGTLNAGVTTATLLAIMLNGAGATPYAGDSASGLYLWGGQMELPAFDNSPGWFPSSYVGPTAGAALERAAEKLVVPVAWGPQDLTAYARLARPLWADLATDFSSRLSHFYLFEVLDLSGLVLFNIVGLNSSRTWSANYCQNVVTAAIPAGATLEVCAQARNATTSPAVAIDAGSGFGAFSSTGNNPTSGSWSDRNPGFGLGCSTGGNPFHGRILSLLIARGLHTRAEMAAVA